MHLLSKILNPKKLISSLPSTITIYNSARSIRKYDFKVRRIFSVSRPLTGCFIAGCCFSKKKETLLPSKSDASGILNEAVVETSDFRNQNDPSRMKHNLDSHEESVPSLRQNTTLSYDVSEPLLKKFKTENKEWNAELDKNCKISHVDQTTVSANPDSLEKKYEIFQPSISGSKAKVFSKKEKPVKKRPNYFVAIQISDDQIKNSLKQVQEHILQQEEKLLKSMISLKTLHITLMVMHIEDMENYNRAMEALRNVHAEFNEEMSQNPLQIKFQGLSHFRNRVLYAKISNHEASNRLTSLAEGVRKHFVNVSPCTEEERFTPHMTVAKIDFKQNRKGIKKIHPSLYEDFADEYFGLQTVKGIQLCSMTSPKNETGYYLNEELYFTGFRPEESMNALKMSIEEQKKDVKDKINNLMKEKIK